MIALIGITIERNVKSKSRKAKPSTNANTIGARCFIVWLKSTLAAVSPVTASCVPAGSVASTGGITSVRRTLSARIAVASWPLPARGKSTRATVFALLTETRIGWWITPVALQALEQRRRLAQPEQPARLCLEQAQEAQHGGGKHLAHPALDVAVAKLAQQRRQHRQRADQRDEDDEHRADPDRGEDLRSR